MKAIDNKIRLSKIDTAAALVMERTRTPANLPSWDVLAARLNISIPESYYKEVFSAVTLRRFLNYWIDEDPETFARKPESTRVLKYDLDNIPRPFYGKVQLFPEQQYIIQPILDKILQPDGTAVLQDCRTGGGKTFVSAAICAELFKSSVFDSDEWLETPTLIRVYTPKAVRIQYYRVFCDCGLKEYIDDGRIVIDNYAALYSSRSVELLREVYDSFNDITTVKWHGVARPYLTILDECHVLANPGTKQTKAIRALANDGKRTHFIHFSATPFVKVNDTETFVATVRRPLWHGKVVDSSNFKLFAADHAADPSKPNVEAIKRVRATLSNHIISMPYVKWPSRQVNSVVVCDFSTERDREVYNAAYKRWQDAAAKLGKSPSSKFEAWIALGQFSKAAEPLRAHYFTNKIISNFRAKSKATIIATRFKSTIIKTLHQLIQAGLTRRDISIIWGGVDRVNPDNLMDYNEAVALLQSSAIPDDKTFRRIEATLDFYEDRIMAGETEEEQAERHALLHSWGLFGAQSADARQLEIDRFQSGESTVCLFTCAAGGTGLSLDKNRKSLLDREVYISPTFNGREAAQAMGRTVRRATVQPQVFQYMCFLRGTVEETMIMPIMDSKLACIAGMNKANLDMAKVWLDAATGQHVPVPSRVRELNEAINDSNNDESQSIDNGSNDEDDDNE